MVVDSVALFNMVCILTILSSTVRYGTVQYSTVRFQNITVHVKLEEQIKGHYRDHWQ